MTLEAIGHLTLNISFVLYLLVMLPQLIHNLLAKQTQSLSLSMHGILFFAYLTDWIYAFGRGMPLQYKLVTLVGLVCLTAQHFQFYIAQKNDGNFRRNFFVLSFLLLCLFVFGSISLYQKVLSLNQLVFIESLSQVGWLTYVFPQIYKNWSIKSTKGVSLFFVLIAMCITICDSVSAWTLNWDLPIRLGSPILFLIKLILLGQFVLYTRSKSRIETR